MHRVIGSYSVQPLQRGLWMWVHGPFEVRDFGGLLPFTSILNPARCASTDTHSLVYVFTSVDHCVMLLL